MNHQSGSPRNGVSGACWHAGLVTFLLCVLAGDLASTEALVNANPRTNENAAATQQAARRLANAEEAERLGVAKLFGSTKLRNFGTHAQFSPDGEQLLGCFGFGFATFDIETAEMRQVPMKARIDSLSGCKYSPDGTRAIVRGQSGISMWDPATGEAIFLSDSEAAEYARDMAWSPDGTRFVTGHYDGVVKVWDAETGEAIASNQRKDPGPGLFLDRTAWSAGDKYYACGGAGADFPIFIYDAKTHEEVAKLDAGLAGDSKVELVALKFVTDDQLLICGPRTVAADGEEQIVTDLKLWNVSTGEELLAFPRAAELGEPEAICLTPDRRQVVVKSGSVVRFFDLTTGDLAKDFPEVPTTRFTRELAISPDGSTLAYGGDMLFLLDVETGAWLHAGDEIGHIGDYYQSLSPDSKLLMTVGEDDGRVIFWDTETCLPATTIDLGRPLTWRGQLWAPDGSLFYVFANRVADEAWRTDKPLVVMAFDPRRRVKVFEAEFPNRINSQRGFPTISSDSQQLVLRYPGVVGGFNHSPAVAHFINAKNGLSIRKLEIPGLAECQTFRLTPDGKFILTTFFGGAERFKIWDAQTGEYVHGEKGLDRGIVRYTADGGVLVGVSDEREAVVYDTVARRELHRIKIPDMFVNSASIINDEWFGVSTYQVEEVDGQRRYITRETSIWDIKTGQSVHTLNTPIHSGLTLSADGKYVYSSLGVPVAREFAKLIKQPD